jgi:hypothetical protein
MNRAPRWIAFVAVAAVALVLPAAPAQGVRRPDPIARAACGRFGCTESENTTFPGPSEGAVATDALPAAATQGTIKVGPTTNVNQEPTFDDMVEGFATSYPKIGKLNKTFQQIITCAYISAAAVGVSTDEHDGTRFFRISQELPDVYALVLRICLETYVFPTLKARDATAASSSSRCLRVDTALAVKITRTRAGYTAVANATAHKASSAHTPVAISCKRSGSGVQLTVRPRARGQTLRQAVGPTLGMDYINPSHKTVPVHTTFVVN